MFETEEEEAARKAAHRFARDKACDAEMAAIKATMAEVLPGLLEAARKEALRIAGEKGGAAYRETYDAVFKEATKKP